MSKKDLIKDIAEMHSKFGTNEAVQKFDSVKLKQYLDFRIRFLQEELAETITASKSGDADGIVDGCIDLIVIAIGTLDAFGVDAYTAWDRVHSANMQKEVGVKASRPNTLGLPDLVKPAGWVSPTHVDNVGLLAMVDYSH